MSEEDLIFGNLPGRRRRQSADDDFREFREVPWFEEKGPLPWPWWRGGSGMVAGAPIHSAQAVAYLARTVGGNEGGNGANIVTLIDGLVADGVWSKLDALYVLAQQNQTDALLNLIGTSYGLTKGSDGSTFTAYIGFQGFTTGLNSGFNPTTAPSPNFTQNSASLGAWVYSVTNNSLSTQMGLDSTLTHIVACYAGNFYARVNNGSIASVSAGAGTGLYVGDRESASNVNPFINGVDQGALAGVSSTITNNVLLIGNCPGGAFAATEIPLSAAFIGASLGASRQLALYNRLQSYMTAIPTPVTSVWSAADAATNGMTLSNGGLTATMLSGSGSKSIRNTVSKSSGKVYIEFLCSSTNAGNYGLWGVGSSGFDPTSYFGNSSFSAGIYSGNQTFVSTGFTSNYAVPFPAPIAGDVYALAVDFTAGGIWIALNNVWQNSSNPASGSLPIFSFVPATVGALFAGLSMNAGIAIIAWTIQPTVASQKYAPPTGFSAWG